MLTRYAFYAMHTGTNFVGRGGGGEDFFCVPLQYRNRNYTDYIVVLQVYSLFVFKKVLILFV
jgi:hypothetical protein